MLIKLISKYLVSPSLYLMGIFWFMALSTSCLYSSSLITHSDAQIQLEKISHNDLNQQQIDWINYSLVDLMSPSAELSEVEASYVDLEDYQRTRFRIVNNGQIHFEDGTYLKFATHSSHQNKEVGDISLAVCSDNNWYVNFGHVCGGIIHFATDEIINNISIKTFLNHFNSQIDNKSWNQLNSWDL